MNDTEWFQGKRVELTDLNKDERGWLREKIGWALVTILAATILYFGLPLIYSVRAQAAEVLRFLDDKGGPASLRLYEEKCTNETVNAQLRRMQVTPENIARFKRSTLFYWGREWASCWIELSGRILSIDEEGSPLRPIPRSAFRDETI